MSDTKKNDLVGHVRSIRSEKAYFLLKNERYIEGSRIPLQATTYNIEGYITEEVRYDKDGLLAFKRIFVYEAEGKLSERLDYEPSGSLRTKSIYTQTSDGHILEESGHDASGSITDKTVHNFDDNNNPKELATYNAEGSLMAKMLFTHDAYGRLSEIHFYGGKFTNSITPLLEEGHFALVSNSNEESNSTDSPRDCYLIGKTLFKYDNKGRPIKQADYLANDSLVKRRVSSTEPQGDNGLIEEYDGNGVLQNREFSRREFDSSGNWIKNIISKWSIKTGKYEPVEVTYRDIIYY